MREQQKTIGELHPYSTGEDDNRRITVIILDWCTNFLDWDWEVLIGQLSIPCQIPIFIIANNSNIFN